MQARRGANFVTNAVPFFAFMVGGSYGISVLLQVRDPPLPLFLELLHQRLRRRLLLLHRLRLRRRLQCPPLGRRA